MPDAEYNWGSNRNKAYAGVHNFDFATFNINSAQQALYKEVGQSYLHYLHGINPMGIVMLSNMYEYGADSSANEIYHSWYNHNTIWDNAKTSSKGPAPGYLTGGPNPDYGSWYGVNTLVPPFGQPRQKAYRDWNTGWNGSADEASWSITEPSIHNQAVYVSLLARTIASNVGSLLPVSFLQFNVFPTSSGNQLDWRIDDAMDVHHFEVERSFNGSSFITLKEVPKKQGALQYTYTDLEKAIKTKNIYYRIKAVLRSGEIKYSFVQKISSDVKNHFGVTPNPAKTYIYVNGSLLQDERINLHIVTTEGVTIHKEDWLLQKGVFSKYISIEKLPAGIYWVKMITRHGETVEKIIKQ
jgi:hypothetical protein